MCHILLRLFARFCLPLIPILPPVPVFFRASPTLAHRPIEADAQAQRVYISRGIRDWPLVTLFS